MRKLKIISRQKRHNEICPTKGFSLIELVVALALLLIMTTFVTGAFTNAVRSQRRERGVSDRDRYIKRAIELMVSELAQAGVTPAFSDHVVVSNIAGTTVNLAPAAGYAANVTSGLYPQRPIILGLPESGASSEKLIISTVTIGSSVATTTAATSGHTAPNDGISSPVFPNPFGILNPVPAAAGAKTVNRIGFVGDLLSDGEMYYVEYSLSGGSLVRTCRRIRDGNGTANVSLLDNVTALSFTITYSANLIATRVDISITAQSSAPEPQIKGGKANAGAFQAITVKSDVVPRGTAAADLIWSNYGQNNLRSMAPPCSNTTGANATLKTYPPCTSWNGVPTAATWWGNVYSYAYNANPLP
jgi:prepilin-type N-terminal cleavage/methylation domain-containing protein